MRAPGFLRSGGSRWQTPSNRGLRRGRIDLDDRDAGLVDLSRLAIKIDAGTNLHAWTATLGLSTRHRLTVYDACYLELALRRGLPLATLDRMKLQQRLDDIGRT